MASFLASYRPLAITARGRLVSAHNKIPLFVDGSCRREPDFESPQPSITALCRGNNFVPRLQIGDDVAYVTVKSDFGTNVEPHYRLVAHLQVIAISNSHDEAATWYLGNKLPLPSNCMVDGNAPKPYQETNGLNGRAYRKHSDEVRLRSWDREYKNRAMRTGMVVHCAPLFLELNSPPPLFDTDFIDLFERVPGTRNPPRLDTIKVQELVNFARNRNFQHCV